MDLISRDELKERLDRGDEFKLVMTLGEFAFRGKHIPGSLNIYVPELAKEQLDQEDDIVVYCSNPSCSASIMAYHFLMNNGYKHVRRYAGGLLDWEDAGYPLEGELVK